MRQYDSHGTFIRMTMVLGLQDAKDMIHKAITLDTNQMQANWLPISNQLLFAFHSNIC